MATPNYSYEKRQRELAKKRKQEEKRQKKLNHRVGDDAAPGEVDAPEAAAGSGAAGAAAPDPQTGRA